MVRPLDTRNVTVLVEAFNRIGNIEIAVDQVIVDAEATGESYFSVWLQAAQGEVGASKLLEFIGRLSLNPSVAKKAIDDILAEFSAPLPNDEDDTDLSEDITAWKELSRSIVRDFGKNVSLDQFLQQLQLRSKEPPPKPDTVALMTIHGAKGREFDTVYVIGLAEDMMPSYHSRQTGDDSPEMEEERRNCFVAITRAKERLILSRAERYRGWQKQPSRFLVEMGLAQSS